MNDQHEALRTEVIRTMRYAEMTARDLERHTPEAAGAARTIALLRDIAAGLRRALDGAR